MGCNAAAEPGRAKNVQHETKTLMILTIFAPCAALQVKKHMQHPPASHERQKTAAESRLIAQHLL
jgi:hypothetical protein